MKKILSLVLAVALVLTLSCAALAEGYSGDLKVWVPEAAVDFTNAQIEAFKAANPDYAGMNVTVEPVGEGDAAGKVIADVEAAADVFNFAQDQLARRRAGGRRGGQRRGRQGRKRRRLRGRRHHGRHPVRLSADHGQRLLPVL